MPVISFDAMASRVCTPKGVEIIMQGWLYILVQIGLIAESIFYPAHIVEFLNWAVGLIP